MKNKYECKHCGKVQELESEKAWVKSICGRSGDKDVHLVRLDKRRKKSN